MASTSWTTGARSAPLPRLRSNRASAARDPWNFANAAWSSLFFFFFFFFFFFLKKKNFAVLVVLTLRMRSYVCHGLPPSNRPFGRSTTAESGVSGLGRAVRMVVPIPARHVTVEAPAVRCDRFRPQERGTRAIRVAGRLTAFLRLLLTVICGGLLHRRGIVAARVGCILGDGFYNWPYFLRPGFCHCVRRVGLAAHQVVFFGLASG